VPRVVVFVAQGCHLCEAALEIVGSVCGEGYEVVDITGDTALEAQYRERIPVVEVDGIERFTYLVTPEGLRAAIG
jgi:hypothetical protein